MKRFTRIICATNTSTFIPSKSEVQIKVYFQLNRLSFPLLRNISASSKEEQSPADCGSRNSYPNTYVRHSLFSVFRSYSVDRGSIFVLFCTMIALDETDDHEFHSTAKPYSSHCVKRFQYRDEIISGTGLLKTKKKKQISPIRSTFVFG